MELWLAFRLTCIFVLGTASFRELCILFDDAEPCFESHREAFVAFFGKLEVLIHLLYFKRKYDIKKNCKKFADRYFLRSVYRKLSAFDAEISFENITWSRRREKLFNGLSCSASISKDQIEIPDDDEIARAIDNDFDKMPRNISPTFNFAVKEFFREHGVKYTLSEKFSEKAQKCFEAMEQTIQKRKEEMLNQVSLPSSHEDSGYADPPKKRSKKDALPVIITEPVSDDDEPTVVSEDVVNNDYGYENCKEVAELFQAAFTSLKSYLEKVPNEVNFAFGSVINRLSDASFFLNEAVAQLDKSIDLEPYIGCYVNPSRLFFMKTKKEIDNAKAKIEKAEQLIGQLQIDLHMHDVTTCYHELFQSLGLFDACFSDLETVEASFSSHLSFLGDVGIAMMKGRRIVEVEPKWENCQNIAQFGVAAGVLADVLSKKAGAMALVSTVDFHHMALVAVRIKLEDELNAI